MISLVKNVKCISRLSIHYFDFCWLDIDRILHFVFHVRYHKIPTHFKKVWVCVCVCGGGGYTPPPVSAWHALAPIHQKCLLHVVYFINNLSQWNDTPHNTEIISNLKDLWKSLLLLLLNQSCRRTSTSHLRQLEGNLILFLFLFSELSFVNFCWDLYCKKKYCKYKI